MSSNSAERKFTKAKGRVSLTIATDVHEQGQERGKSLGYGSFSEYVEHLIRADLTARAGHSVTRSEEGLLYSAFDTKPASHTTEADTPTS